MTYLDWLSEANDSLTRTQLKRPDSWDLVEPIQAFVKLALARPDDVDVEQIVRDTLGRMTAVAVSFHEFEEDFMPVVEKGMKHWRL